MKLQLFVLIAGPVLMALLAAGAVLMLKLKRRRQAPSADDVANVVPVRPLGAAQAARWKDVYTRVTVTVLVVLAIYGLALYAFL